MHAGKTYDAKTMTLERFGFIGMNKKCFWGMVGVDWVTPLKIHQINPNGVKPKPPNKPKPPAEKTPLSDSKILNAAQQKSLLTLFAKEHKMSKLYDAEKDGWKKTDFAPKVFDKGNTFHVI